MSDEDQAVERVQSLIEQTELVSIRLTELNVQTAEFLPEAMAVDFGITNIAAAGGPAEVEGGDGGITVAVSHAVRCYKDDETFGTINFTHQAIFRFTGNSRPEDETVGHWVNANVVFMLYPYVREVVQSTSMRVGLPAIVLGYLNRNSVMPVSLTATDNDIRIE